MGAKESQIGRKGTPDTMKVLILATAYPPGHGYGMARYASELAEALVAIGHEVHVLTCRWSEDGETRQRGAVSVHSMRPPRVMHFDWVGNAVLDNIRLLERGLELNDERGPFDALINHDWPSAHASKSLKAILGLPWLLVMHGTEVGRRGNRLTRQQLYAAEMEAWATGHADHVLATSEFIGGELQRSCQVPPDKVTACPCGLNISRFQSSTNIADFRRLFAEDTEKLLVYAGRLSPEKGVEDLAEAFGILAVQGRRVQLVLAGDGVLMEHLEKQFAEAGLPDRVFLTGWLSDKVLGALYQAADVVVVPSRHEAFGMVAIEAAGSGAAVVATKAGGLAEIVRRSGGAIVGAQPGDPRGLCEAIRSVIDDPERRRDLTERAQAHVVATYSWEKVAEAVSSLLSRLTRRGATASAAARSI